MRFIRNSFLFALMILVVGCSKTGNRSLADKSEGSIEDYEMQSVNAVEQARPTIMVIPSDILMKRYGALKTQKINGVNTNIYDYNKYLLANNDNKALLSVITENFVDQNYPVQDFEQTLKQLRNNEILDEADGIGKDTKTILLTTAQPDLIIELDYAARMNMRGNMNSTYSYTLNVIDPYTNNVIATSTQSDLKGDNVLDALSKPMKNNLAKINHDIVKSFSEISERGRNITVRINIAKDCPFNLDNRSITGKTYADWIVDYVKTHTVKGAYKLERNTAKELYFVNCRIKLLNDDNTQYGVYDWARDMSDSLYKNLGVESTNKAQGLGEVVITINGLK
ncbi:MAG: hypothetical protein J1F07_03895 [Muribaculaceae bacterium]|nr:hypothetical protein [Muribaculaceae bacterium]